MRLIAARRCVGIIGLSIWAIAANSPALAQSTPAAWRPLPTTMSALIRTPPAAENPRINGPRLYGQRPGRPFLYTIPATGRDPITFAASGLPDGLTLDANLGRISGVAAKAGEYSVTITASNALGTDTQTLRIRIGDQLCLTPPMGWNSWNCFANAVDQDKVLSQAKIFVHSGLAKHGWTYINIDDTWQGARTGQDLALQPNKKFPDMKGLCDQIHAMGLKAGIYSTPWATSYAGFCGGSSQNADGSWTPPPAGRKHFGTLPYAVGLHHFMAVDSRQWADWGFDYLKYDWNPITIPDVAEMTDALAASGRDIVYSLSNHATFEHAADYAGLANCWRTTGDITDTWASMHGIGFAQDRWAQFAGTGHWNDPDMLVVGTVGWGHLRHSRLTPDEQYTHITLWCLLSAPLLLGTDLTKMDDFTYGLLSNDEVLAVDQDALGREAMRLGDDTPTTQPSHLPQQVYAKPLADGTWAVGLFNLSDQEAPVTLNLVDLKLTGPQTVRDLWRQKNLPDATDQVTLSVAPHGAELLKIGSAH
jgi:alpha-galactosidase